MPEISAEVLSEGLGSMAEKLTVMSERWTYQQAREIPPGISESMQKARVREAISEAVAGDLRLALLQLGEALESARKAAATASQVVEYSDRKTRQQAGFGLTITY